MKIEYNIKLNDKGKPYIDLSENYENNPEDKFFVVQLTRYLLINLYNKENGKYDEKTLSDMQTTLNFLEVISDQMGTMIKEFMDFQEVSELTINKKYDFQVDSVDDLLKIKYDAHIATNGKIYKRKEGLRVLVTNQMIIYELIGGIENSNWTISK